MHDVISKIPPMLHKRRLILQSSLLTILQGSCLEARTLALVTNASALNYSLCVYGFISWITRWAFFGKVKGRNPSHTNGAGCLHSHFISNSLRHSRGTAGFLCVTLHSRTVKSNSKMRGFETIFYFPKPGSKLHISTPYFVNTHFNMILQSTPRSPKWSCIHECHMSNQSHPP
jgi:hypothetical protein